MANEVDPVVTKSVLDAALKDAVADIAAVIGDFSDRVDERFNKIESDVSELKSDVSELKYDVATLKSDMAEVKQEVTELNFKYNHLINTLDAFMKRLDDAETDNAARDAQLARLDRWLHQMAAKLDIELR